MIFRDVVTHFDGRVEIIEYEPPPQPPVIRERVTKAALKMAAGQMGLLATIEALVAQLPFDAPAKILWENASEFKRSDILWNFFAPQLDLSSEDVDNLFNMAGQIDDAFR